MNTDIERYQKLKAEVDQLNNQIAQVQGQRTQQEAQLQAIYKKHDVKILADLEKKVQDADAQAEKVGKRAEEFIAATAPRISKIQSALSGTTEVVDELH